MALVGKFRRHFPNRGRVRAPVLQRSARVGGQAANDFGRTKSFVRTSGQSQGLQLFPDAAANYRWRQYVSRNSEVKRGGGVGDTLPPQTCVLPLHIFGRGRPSRVWFWFRPLTRTIARCPLVVNDLYGIVSEGASLCIDKAHLMDSGYMFCVGLGYGSCRSHTRSLRYRSPLATCSAPLFSPVHRTGSVGSS